jgi:hypothetical protein
VVRCADHPPAVDNGARQERHTLDKGRKTTVSWSILRFSFARGCHKSTSNAVRFGTPAGMGDYPRGAVLAVLTACTRFLPIDTTHEWFGRAIAGVGLVVPACYRVSICEPLCRRGLRDFSRRQGLKSRDVNESLHNLCPNESQQYNCGQSKETFTEVGEVYFSPRQNGGPGCGNHAVA